MSYHGVFPKSKRLTHLYWNNFTLDKVSQYAFCDCTALGSDGEELVLPENIKTIERYAFYNCGYLKLKCVRDTSIGEKGIDGITSSGTYNEGEGPTTPTYPPEDDPSGTTVLMSAINVDNEEFNLTTGDNGTFTYSVLPADTTEYVIARSSNSDIIQISRNGNTISYEALDAGIAYVNLTSSKGSVTKRVTFNVTTIDNTIYVESISSTSMISTVGVGDEGIVSFTYTPSNATEAITARSSNTAVLTVNKVGTNINYKAIAQGSVEIIISSASGGVIRRYSVTVTTAGGGDVSILRYVIYIEASNKYIITDYNWTNIKADGLTSVTIPSIINGKPVALDFGGDGSGIAGGSEGTSNVTQINLTPDTLGYIGIGENKTCTVSFSPASATEDITATSSNTSVLYVSRSGTTITCTGVKTGEATLTVQNVSGTVKRTIDVNVVKKITAMSFSKSNIDGYVGDTSSFTVTLTPSDATEPYNITAQDTSIVNATKDGNTINYTLVGHTSGPNNLITLTSVASGITKSIGGTIIRKVETINIVTTQSEINTDETKTIVISYTPTNATETITATSSDTSKLSVTKSGNNIACKGLAVGSVYVTIQNARGNVQKVVNITVVKKITAITTSKSDISGTIGESNGSGSFTVTVTPTDTTESYTVTSLDTSLVTITKSGNTVNYTLVGHTSNSVDLIKIASASSNVTKTITGKITRKITAINISSYPSEVYVGSGATVSYSITPTNANETLTIKSSNTNIMTVSKSTATGGGSFTVTGVGPGSATITITSSIGNVSRSVTITSIRKITGMTLQTFDGVTMQSDYMQSHQGFSSYFVVSAISPSDANEDYTVTSLDTSIVTVSKSGSNRINFSLIGYTTSYRQLIKIQSASGSFTKYIYIMIDQTIEITGFGLSNLGTGYSRDTIVGYSGKTISYRLSVTPTNHTELIGYSKLDNAITAISGLPTTEEGENDILFYLTFGTTITSYYQGFSVYGSKGSYRKYFDVDVKRALTSITSSPTNIITACGATGSVSLTFTPSNHEETWNAWAGNLLTISSISGNTINYSVSTSGYGGSYIHVRSDSGTELNISVNIKLAISSFTTSVSLLSLVEGDTGTITVTAEPSYNSSKEGWYPASSNSNIIQITSFSSTSLTYKAMRSGTANIILCAEITGYRKLISVNVREAKKLVNAFIIDEEDMNLTATVGDTGILYYDTSPGEPDEDWTVTSSNTNVLTITSYTTNQVRYRAVGSGTAYIQFRSDSNQASEDVTVTVQINILQYLVYKQNTNEYVITDLNWTAIKNAGLTTIDIPDTINGKAVALDFGNTGSGSFSY